MSTYNQALTTDNLNAIGAAIAIIEAASPKISPYAIVKAFASPLQLFGLGAPNVAVHRGLDRMMQDVMQDVPADMPAALTTVQQAQVEIGYHKQKAIIYKKIVA